VARDYGFDASLIGYQISLVSIGMLATLTLLGNVGRKLGACAPTRPAMPWWPAAC